MDFKRNDLTDRTAMVTYWDFADNEEETYHCYYRGTNKKGEMTFEDVNYKEYARPAYFSFTNKNPDFKVKWL